MLAAKLILVLILFAVASLGVSEFASNLNATGCSGMLLTLFIFSTSIYKLMRTDKIKTVYLCIAIAVAYVVLNCHFHAGILSSFYSRFYRAVYGEQNYSVLGSVLFFFWLGFLFLTTTELFRKTEQKLSIFWKIYAVLALVNVISVVGFAINTMSGPIH